MTYGQTSETSPEARVPLQKDHFIDRANRSWGHCEAIIDLTPLNSPNATGLFVNEAWLTSNCIFVQRAMDGNSHIHESKHFRNSGNMLFVSRFLSGHSLGRSGDTPYAIYPGSISIRDYSRAFDGIQTAGIVQGVFFLHETLGFEPGQNPSLRVFHEHCAIAQALHAEFNLLFAHLSKGDTDVARDQLARIKNCIELAVHGEKAKADVRAVARDSLKRAICADIELNLTDQSYSVKTILRRFGTSRATLFRMFEIDGGVRNYIHNRRLNRAVLHISKTPMTRGVISDAARKWGFSSNANFNRSVRRVYGTSPGSLFEAPVQRITIPQGSHAIWADQRRQLMRRGEDAYSARQQF